MKPEDIKEQELSEEQLDEATGGHVDSSGQQNRNGEQLQNRGDQMQNRMPGQQNRNPNGDGRAPGRG
jgi:hypothetical protein